MKSNNQLQKAGDNSQQLQIVNPTINLGITEERAREIFFEMNAIARQNYTQDAYELAMKRVGMFEELLMNKIKQVDGMLDTFRDPSFQFLLIEAQKRAAASDRESDFEMLTELLAHRIQKKSDRKVQASISKAVEIVDQVDDDALCGLTMVHAISSWGAMSGDLLEGLSMMNDLFSSLCYRSLPVGNDWVDHLDILDAVRVLSIGKFKRFMEYYPNRFDGYTCAGIPKDSKNYERALEILQSIGLSTTFLVPHELNDGYVRLRVPDRTSFADINLYSESLGKTERRKIAAKEVEALNEIWNLYSDDVKLIGQIKHAFMEKWDSFDALRSVRIWYETIPYSFSITPIGKVLAHANAMRYNKEIPPINGM